MSCMSAGMQVPGTTSSVSGTVHLSQTCGGCDHCVAVQTGPALAAGVPAPMPQVITLAVDSPPSVTRTPLHPPPVA